jgi:RHS repeat-associated protein
MAAKKATNCQFGYVDEAFAYTGRLFDQTTGLQNNLNRWYDASVARWLSEDPIGFAAGDGNLYRYVGNGPTYGVDPEGFETPTPSKKGSSPGALYCHFLTPGNNAPADPWLLNWGSEVGLGTGAVSGAGAIGAAVWRGYRWGPICHWSESRCRYSFTHYIRLWNWRSLHMGTRIRRRIACHHVMGRSGRLVFCYRNPDLVPWSGWRMGRDSA